MGSQAHEELPSDNYSSGWDFKTGLCLSPGWHGKDSQLRELPLHGSVMMSDPILIFKNKIQSSCSTADFTQSSPIPSLLSSHKASFTPLPKGECRSPASPQTYPSHSRPKHRLLLWVRAPGVSYLKKQDPPPHLPIARMHRPPPESCSSTQSRSPSYEAACYLGAL